MKISLLSLDPNHSIYITDGKHSCNITRIINDPITPVVVCRVKDPNQISQNNLFFLEKIISRKHAIIYELDNQIYVKDTKSSGGTWINGKRLSNAEVESSPMRLSEDDIIQFGEDTEFDGSKYFHNLLIEIFRAVRFKVHLHIQDNLSPEGKIKLVRPLQNIDPFSPLESPTSGFIERNESWIDPITPAKKVLLDPNIIYHSDSTYNQALNQNLPELPLMPNHIQEELKVLWDPLDRISVPFRNVEILLKKS